MEQTVNARACRSRTPEIRGGPGRRTADLERYVEDFVAAGVPRDAAWRRARIEFGNIDNVTLDCRQARPLGQLAVRVGDAPLRRSDQLLQRARDLADEMVLEDLALVGVEQPPALIAPPWRARRSASAGSSCVRWNVTSTTIPSSRNDAAALLPWRRSASASVPSSSVTCRCRRCQRASSSGSADSDCSISRARRSAWVTFQSCVGVEHLGLGQRHGDQPSGGEAAETVDAPEPCVGRDLAAVSRELLAQGLGGAFSALGLPERSSVAALRRVVVSERAGHLAEPTLELGDRRARRRLQGVAALDRRPELVLGLA